MRSDHPYTIPIWWFIGVLLTIYGALILGVGVYEEFVPNPTPPVLHELRPPIWWGLLLLVMGIIYVKKFPPTRNEPDS